MATSAASAFTTQAGYPAAAAASAAEEYDLEISSVLRGVATRCFDDIRLLDSRQMLYPIEGLSAGEYTLSAIQPIHRRISLGTESVELIITRRGDAVFVKTVRVPYAAIASKVHDSALAHLRASSLPSTFVVCSADEDEDGDAAAAPAAGGGGGGDLYTESPIASMALSMSFGQIGSHPEITLSSLGAAVSWMEYNRCIPQWIVDEIMQLATDASTEDLGFIIDVLTYLQWSIKSNRVEKEVTKLIKTFVSRAGNDAAYVRLSQLSLEQRSTVRKLDLSCVADLKPNLVGLFHAVEDLDISVGVYRTHVIPGRRATAFSLPGTLSHLRHLNTTNREGFNLSSVLHCADTLEVLKASHIGDSAFPENMTALRKLSVAGNKLVTAAQICTCVHLQQLDIKRTNIKRLPVELTRLEVIHASGVKGFDLDRVPVSVVELDVSNCDLSGDVVQDWPAIRTLNVAGNSNLNLQSLNRFKDTLRVLDASHIVTGLLPTELKSLRVLHINGNTAAHDISLIAPFDELEELSVAKTGLNTLFYKEELAFPKLRVLDISKTSVPADEVAVLGTQLESLFASRVGWRALPTELTHLKVLNVSGNWQIEARHLEHLEQLKSLYVLGTSVRSIPTRVARTLQFLNASGQRGFRARSLDGSPLLDVDLSNTDIAMIPSLPNVQAFIANDNKRLPSFELGKLPDSVRRISVLKCPLMDSVPVRILKKVVELRVGSSILVLDPMFFSVGAREGRLRPPSPDRVTECCVKTIENEAAPIGSMTKRKVRIGVRPH